MKAAPLVVVALLALSALVMAPANAAGDGPKVTRWWRISVPAEPGTGRASAWLGRRRSADEGSRAAFRMLSRLIWWYPREGIFEVTFSYPSGKGGERTGNVMYVPRDNLVMGSPNKWETRFVAVRQPTIHRIAQRRGKIEDLAKYDTLALDQPIIADWGKRPSMDAGLRDSVQALGRATRRPLPVSCTLYWYIMRPGGFKVEVTVDYNPADKEINLLVVPAGREKSTSERYILVSRRAVRTVARKNGTVRDLLHYGTKVEPES